MLSTGLLKVGTCALCLVLFGCERNVSFADDVQPILAASCVVCHDKSAEGYAASGFSLDELWYHLKIQDVMKPVVDAGKVVNCIPTAMPFIDSLFMPREAGDRPDVLPEGATNFAFLGQFAEVPHDCVFTVEYSVRCAQMAVYGLFEADKEVLPVYGSKYMPKHLVAAVQAISR